MTMLFCGMLIGGLIVRWDGARREQKLKTFYQHAIDQMIERKG